MKPFKEHLSDLRAAITRIEQEGVSIRPLNDALHQLETHAENISKVEVNIDAIRDEVLNPIRSELEENKKAGKFSIAGFWLSIIALIFSIGTSGYNAYLGARSSENVNSAVKLSGFVVKHNGSLNILVLDKKGVLQPLAKVYVSCSKETGPMVANGRTSVEIPINEAEYAAINCLLTGSKDNRWLADVWHNKYQNETLVLDNYRVFVNGVLLGPESVIQEGDHANYSLKLQRISAGS